MTIILATAILPLACGGPVLGQVDYTDREQYNRTHDPDIDRGYNENQQYNRQREDREERTQRGEIPDPYSVDISGQDSAAGKHGK